MSGLNLVITILVVILLILLVVWLFNRVDGDGGAGTPLLEYAAARHHTGWVRTG